MKDQVYLTTDRLLLQPLTITDDSFIFELLNSEGWIRFIGNRNITSTTRAVDYIKKILANSNISYWVVKLKETRQKIGLVTYIKRDYLEYRDIGFAFLPHFSKKGYAYEATNAVLNKLITEENLSTMLAITVPDNISSITLLQKMGFLFEKEIEIENEILQVYTVSANALNKQ